MSVRITSSHQSPNHSSVNTECSTLSSTIVAGPVIRHCDITELNFWLVTTESYNFTFKLYVKETNSQERKAQGSSTNKYDAGEGSEYSLLFEAELDSSAEVLAGEQKKSQVQQIKVGKSAYINLITIYAQGNLPENIFPENKALAYDILAYLPEQELEPKSVTSLNHLLYSGQNLPSFVISPTINKVLHGSCRKPHHPDEDGLKQVDAVIENSLIDEANTDALESMIQRPSLLMMSGDQVYVDDVAGPTLNAIHQVIDKLGLFDEILEDQNSVTDSQVLYGHKYSYFQRQHILPTHIEQTLFGQKVNPIFTSVHVENHLITLSEVLAMYLLTWSPELWDIVEIDEPPTGLSAPLKDKYLQELESIKAFHQGLYQVRRAMAHIPVYMIFDDHDITDDWNLTRGWEEAVYSNPFAQQIIGNALVGYFLCQGWGNAPDKFVSVLAEHMPVFNDEGYQHKPALIETLLAFDQWNYTLNTQPKIVVLDTRTQRWRSESNANKPSGLMDWETLIDFQQEIVKEPNVIVVSPAPIYGVKLIETIQRLFTLCGKPLAVDAENWMAHSGTANVILNIFRNPRTPPNFIILSGDVHYSFVYDVTHRFKKNSARIVQITASGIKNTFPEKLLSTLEKLNKVLYSTYSPLNWFTKRRRMKIRVRKPNVEQDTHLLNASGIGVLILNTGSDEVTTEFITSKGREIEFIQYEGDEEP